MHVFLALFQVLAYLLLALAIVLPRLRRPAQAALALTAVLGVVAGAAEGGTRTLTTVHTYAGFEGAEMEVSMVAFPTGTVEAPAWQWPLPFAAFAAAWIVCLLALGGRAPKGPWVLPLAFAWSAMACWLAMQALAAPAELVQPIGLDRFLWPAGLALALLSARWAGSLLALFVMVGGGAMAMRLPAALFSKYASDAHLGTCLDVHAVGPRLAEHEGTLRDIVNPMTQTPFDPRLVEGSTEQQFWLIWLEHVVFYPAVYVMSLFGVAFCAYMFHRHGPDRDA